MKHVAFMLFMVVVMTAATVWYAVEKARGRR